MSQVIHIESREKMSAAQKTFLRLKNKVESLKKDRQEFLHALDECLLYFLKEVNPIQMKIVTALENKILSVYVRLNKGSKQKRAQERDVLDLYLDRLMALVSLIELRPEILAIIREIQGIDCERLIQDSFSMFKKEMESEFRSEGLDVNLDDIKMSHNRDEIIEQIARARAQSREWEPKAEIKEDLGKAKQKDRRALQKKEMQEKHINGLYKQLAKLFHPDLEQDEKKREGKLDLMQQLTSAYANDDLYTLLALEWEWKRNSGDAQIDIPSKQLALYNAMLKDQILKMENDISSLIKDQKYIPIQKYIILPFFNGLSTMKYIREQLLVELTRMERAL